MIRIDPLTLDPRRDSKRFDQLVSQGVLPSTAVKRIQQENQEKLRKGPIIEPEKVGILEEFKQNFSKNYPWMIIGGFLGLIILQQYNPGGSIKSANTYKLQYTTLKLEDISGIDLKALEICRQKGLI